MDRNGSRAREGSGFASGPGSGGQGCRWLDLVGKVGALLKGGHSESQKDPCLTSPQHSAKEQDLRRVTPECQGGDGRGGCWGSLGPHLAGRMASLFKWPTRAAH